MNAGISEFMNEIVSFLQIHNKKDGSGYTVSDNGKRKNIKTTDELVSFIRDRTGSLQGKEWYQAFVQYVNNIKNEQNKEFDDVWRSLMTQLIRDYLVKKAEVRDEIAKTTLPSAFGATYTPCKFMPRHFLNDMDLKILKGLCFCEQNQHYYFELHGRYTILGTDEELQNKKSIAMMKLCRLINDRNCERVGVESYEIFDEIYNVCDKLTATYFDLNRQLEEILKEKLPLDVMVTVFWSDKPINLREFLEIPQVYTAFDYNDKLHSAICKVALNKLLPASAINAGLLNLFFESDGEFFKRYSGRPAGNIQKKFTTAQYLANTLTEPTVLKSRIPILDKAPKVISDVDDEMSEYKFDKYWKKGLVPDQFATKDCKILKAFLSPYTDEEIVAIMGFAYTVWFPSYADDVNMLFKTIGGLFKTNYYGQNIMDILDLCYHPKKSISHVMVGDQWISDPALQENADGTGISTARLIFNDECTENCMEKFKGMSGGSSDTGVNYQKRLLYCNPVTMKIYPKWLFCTNRDVQIQDTSGAFDRRLFIIDKMNADKLVPPYSPSEYNKMRLRELESFFEVAKNSYLKIRKEYGSLLNYVRKIKSISKNLREAYNEEQKIFTYLTVYELLQTAARDPNNLSVFEYKGGIAALRPELVKISEGTCEDNGIKPEALLKWIRETTICEEKNNSRATIKVNNRRNTFYHLHPIKPENIPEVDADLTADTDREINEYLR